MKCLLHGGGLSGYREAIPAITNHFKGCQRVMVIPYAQDNYDKTLAEIKNLVPGIPLYSLHEEGDPHEAIASSDGIWVMNGNSFRLANKLHSSDLIEVVKRQSIGAFPMEEQVPEPT